MLLNSLENMQMKFRKCSIKLNEKQFKKLYETLQYHDGGILPVRVLKHELELSYEDTHKLMIYLSTIKVLQPVYKVFCENDMMSGASKEYNKLSEIPSRMCDRCYKNCILLESVYIEFKVIKNET